MIEENRKGVYEIMQETSAIRVLSEVPKRNDREVPSTELKDRLYSIWRTMKGAFSQQRRNTMAQKGNFRINFS